MDIWLATTNAGKVAEFKSFFHSFAAKLHTLKDVPNYYAPKETGKTFTENALIKAKALKAIINDGYVVAEDSGLEVEGLNALPGVHSARYAGERASDDENNAKLLKMVSLRTPQNRSACFKCSIALIHPNGEHFIFSGVVNGEVAKKLSGTNGFGYDACFIPEGQDKTFAELGVSYKNKVSHRAQAIKSLLDHLRSLNS